MSIATAITNLQGKIANAYTAIEEKGGTLPATRNAANLATAIDDIPQGEVDKRKYGATIDDVYNVYDTGPETNPRHVYFRPMAGVTEFNATNVTDLDANGMRFTFFGKNNLKSASFPALNTIGNLTFQSTFQESGISSVSFPALKYFTNGYGNGDYAFQNAFQGCTSLLSVSFPALSSTPGNYTFGDAFPGCTSLSSVSFPELNIVSNALSTFRNAFAGSGVKYAEFPKLTRAPRCTFERGFQNCTSLSDISFPELVDVGEYGFYGAFTGCNNLKSASFSEVSAINLNGFDTAFKNCAALTVVSFPKLTKLNAGLGGTSQGYQFNEAFMGCVNLKSASFPELSGTTNYAFQKTFEGCTSLTAVSFPKFTEVTSLYAGMPRAFYGCTALPSVSFPVLSAVVNQNAMLDAFMGCTALTSVSFPNLTKADGQAVMKECFKNCTSLTNVSFPELSNINNNYSFEGIFNGCTSLTAVSFPKLAQTSGSKPFGDAFAGTQVTTLSFPELSAIRNSGTNTTYCTFYRNTTITRINFPKLTIIAKGNNDAVDGMYLFNGCTNLAEIHFAAENQTIIEAASGYASKWAAPSGCQIYFDL